MLGKKDEEKKKDEKGEEDDDFTDGSVVNFCEGKAQEERRGGGTVQTGTTRARRTNHVRSRPTTSTSYFQLRLAQPTPLYVLREQRPGTRRPSGLVKLLHNDNVVLTQECSYRCTATTATPAATSIFDEDRRRAGRSERTSAVLSLSHVHYYVNTSSANNATTRRRHRTSGGQRSWRREQR